MRGNRVYRISRSEWVRSIPARAGEPGAPWSDSPYETVYPRACGGTAITAGMSVMLTGLSPRVRGNHGSGGTAGTRRGSIPARAGEPDHHVLFSQPIRVYPRACGGTENSIRMVDTWRGLSPRVRGNRAYQWSWNVWERSIPARAGEPALMSREDIADEVYPRACGGTPGPLRSPFRNSGLSPRVRGNPLVALSYARPVRSIPARAGEPAGQDGR